MKMKTERKVIDALELQILQQEHLKKTNEMEQEANVRRVSNAHDAQEILQLMAQAVQQRAHNKISAVVSQCLSAVFDDPYEFRIEFERKRGKTEANLRFVRRDLDVDPLSASGGGMIDVAAFALRVACLMLSRPKLNRIIILDEPFKFVSAAYRGNVREMMEQLSEDMGIQIIQVTHIEELETGTVIEL